MQIECFLVFVRFWSSQKGSSCCCLACKAKFWVSWSEFANFSTFGVSAHLFPAEMQVGELLYKRFELLELITLWDVILWRSLRDSTICDNPSAKTDSSLHFDSKRADKKRVSQPWSQRGEHLQAREHFMQVSFWKWLVAPTADLDRCYLNRKHSLILRFSRWSRQANQSSFGRKLSHSDSLFVQVKIEGYMQKRSFGVLWTPYWPWSQLRSMRFTSCFDWNLVWE